MNKSQIFTPSLRVRCDLRAGAVVCYDNTNGYLTPVLTPCSTPDYYYPSPIVLPDPNYTPSTPGVQWLNCQQCNGIKLGQGQISSAKCEVCYT